MDWLKVFPEWILAAAFSVLVILIVVSLIRGKPFIIHGQPWGFNNPKATTQNDSSSQKGISWLVATPWWMFSIAFLGIFGLVLFSLTQGRPIYIHGKCWGVNYPQPIDTLNDVPIGTILAFSGSHEELKNMKDWRLCNGDPISRTEFGSLFKVIQTMWGKGDGINTFNLPDLRGRFLRGVDHGADNNPDSQGDVGTSQDWALVDHSHHMNRIADNTQSGGDSIYGYSYQYVALSNVSSEPASTDQEKLPDRLGKKNITKVRNGPKLEYGQEIRPVNSFVNWIIKVK